MYKPGLQWKCLKEWKTHEGLSAVAIWPLSYGWIFSLDIACPIFFNKWLLGIEIGQLGSYLCTFSGLSLCFESPVALFGWILSTISNFTHSIKEKSSILSSSSCYRLQPLMTALVLQQMNAILFLAEVKLSVKCLSFHCYCSPVNLQKREKEWRTEEHSWK